MPPPTKRQKKDSVGGGELDEDDNGSCSAAGQDKADKKQRADGTLKPEWCELSKRAQSRHAKNELLERIRAKIPGVVKLSENSIMLQVASRIKKLEKDIERLEELQSSGESEADDFKDQTEASVAPAIQEGTDGPEAVRAVLPQPTKARGKKLLEYAYQYLTELEEEKRRVLDQTAERKVVLKRKTPADCPADHGK